MRKKSLQVDHVAEARRMAADLIQRESRGPGDTDNAMRRLDRKHGVPYGFLWSLKYRPPRDILLGAWTRLLAAYEAECERQCRLLEAEIEHARTLRDATDAAPVRAAEAVVVAENARPHSG